MNGAVKPSPAVGAASVTGSSPAASTASPAPSPWPTFLLASIAVFLVSLDSTVLFAAFGAVRAGFPAASSADVSWVLNAYTVVYAALLVPAGRLADLHGRKRVFITGVLVFLLASLLCGLAPQVGWLIAARVLQAVGAALLTPASLAIVLSAFPADKRAVAVSLWGAVSGLAAALGPSIGSLVVDKLGWPWAFYLNLPLGLFSVWRGAQVLRESRNPDNAAPLDVPGVLLLVIGVGAIALGIVRSEALGWRAGAVWGSVAAGVLALLAFTRWARHTPAPAIDLTLFKDRTYRFVNLATLSFGMAFAMMFFGFFFFMTKVWHYTLPQAGVAVTPGPLLVIPVAVLSGRWAAKHGHRGLLVGGSLVYALGGLWFWTMAGPTPDYLHTWLPGMFLTGTGVGMVLPALSGAAVAHLPPQRFGIGSAVNQAVRQVGAVMGVAFTVALLGHEGLALADFKWLYGSHIALALVTALLCLPVRTGPRHR
ncbi:MAG TPA: DHA2 family efflux MFS transporter permease subunit [Candidatus Aquabacterium excrementipullorum]|nr:DHA2 family efflux MFS transporter permease subunit [Candidatus Aquabacterium excrementipullorum]